MFLQNLYFHDHFRKVFCHHFQEHVFENTFDKLFDDEDLITEEKPVCYKIVNPLDLDMYEVIIKMCKKYDCFFYTDRGELNFVPKFSNRRNTFWTILALEYGVPF